MKDILRFLAETNEPETLKEVEPGRFAKLHRGIDRLRKGFLKRFHQGGKTRAADERYRVDKLQMLMMPMEERYFYTIEKCLNFQLNILIVAYWQGKRTGALGSNCNHLGNFARNAQ